LDGSDIPTTQYKLAFGVSKQSGHKTGKKSGIHREFFESGKFMEFPGNSVPPLGKNIRNKIILVQFNICIKQLLTG